MKFIINKYNIQKINKKSFLFEKYNKSNQNMIFDTIEDAEEELKQILEKEDKSSKAHSSLTVQQQENPMFNSLSRYSKSYMYNSLQFSNVFNGFSFTIGIIAWNKETNEISFKLIEESLVNKLFSIMPNLYFMKDVIDINKRHLEIYKKQEDINSLKKYITSYGTNYPLTHGFKFKLGNLILDHQDSIEDFDINNTVDSLYDSYIANHFRPRPPLFKKGQSVTILNSEQLENDDNIKYLNKFNYFYHKSDRNSGEYIKGVFDSLLDSKFYTITTKDFKNQYFTLEDKQGNKHKIFAWMTTEYSLVTE